MDPVSLEFTGVTSKRETPKYGPSIMEVDWGGKVKANHASECMLLEVDFWGAHDSSFLLYLEHIDLEEGPKDFFTQ